jgi:Flp pilus assembly protein TadG
VIFALASPLVIGSAGFTVETSYWYYKQHQLQSAADDAAYAAGLEGRSGSVLTALQAAALTAATTNGYDNATGTITVQNPPASGPYAGNDAAVTVILTQNEQRFFSQLFSNTTVVANASATSVHASSSNACILSLDPSASRAAYFSGSSALTLNGCVVMADSAASDGMFIWGSTNLTADCAVAVGGVQNGGGLHETACSQPRTGVLPAPDPYGNVPAPSTSGSCVNPSGNTFQPGVYCGGLTVQGNKSMAAGVYVINGGTFKVNNNANLSGSGVMVYLTGGASLDINGGATITLSPATSGTYAGMLFFGDRSSPGVVQTFNGTASSQLTGVLYFPTQNVTYLGNFSGANGCTQIVGDMVSYSGNATFGINCTAYGMKPVPAEQKVKLVG